MSWNFLSLNVQNLRLSNECVRITTFSSNEIPGHIHKASAAVVVVAQAVWVCIPHTAVLVLVDNWDTEALDHSGKDLGIIKWKKKVLKMLERREKEKHWILQLTRTKKYNNWAISSFEWPTPCPRKAPLLPQPVLQQQKHLLLFIYSLFNINACSCTSKITGQRRTRQEIINMSLFQDLEGSLLMYAASVPEFSNAKSSQIISYV